MDTKITSFAKLTKQVHLINDLILSDMTYGTEVYAQEALTFSKHLLATKYWFARISWPNKRRYALTLLNDVKSAWALSLLLKSMWNCRPKDAVLSASEVIVWSSYDQVPMDHNRTAQPVKTLAQVMTSDRKWFHSLEPEAQVMVLSELLAEGGGPLMWEVLRRAQHIYERYRTNNLLNLLECIVVNDYPDKAVEKLPPPATAPPEKKKESQNQTAATSKNFAGMSGTADVTFKPPQKNATKELEISLATWNAAIKSIRDSQKLEELEMTFNDGTKRKVWKVNRVKPEAVETVDFVQLLPSSIGKHILSFLPRSQLIDYAKVNKYWAYLIDEFKAELTARQKLNADLEKLQAIMLKYDTSMEVLAETGYPAPSSFGNSMAPSARVKMLPSMRPSEKSAGAVSFRHFIDDKLKNPVRIFSMEGVINQFVVGRLADVYTRVQSTPSLLDCNGNAQKPIRNLAEMTDRLDRRGAADPNLWAWCDDILKQLTKKHKKKPEEGVLRLGDMHFPCPMMKQAIDLPLSSPLRRDPSVVAAKTTKGKRAISNANMMNNMPKDQNTKRFSLWSRDFSSLYKVYKVASYQSPV